MADELFVNDQRLDDDSSLQLISRLTDYADLQAVFHVTVDRSLGWDAAPSGAPVFKLVGFSVRGGPAFFNKVSKEDGAPFEGVLINAWYPNHDVEQNWQPIPRYEAPAFGGFTNGEGVWGLAIGGLLTDVDSGGPAVLWPNADPDKYADAVRGIGWYPGTDHVAAHPEWQYVHKPGGTIPPSTDIEYLVNIAADGTKTGHIAFVPGVPGIGNAALGLMRGGIVVGHVDWK